MNKLKLENALWISENKNRNIAAGIRPFFALENDALSLLEQGRRTKFPAHQPNGPTSTSAQLEKSFFCRPGKVTSRSGVLLFSSSTFSLLAVFSILVCHSALLELRYRYVLRSVVSPPSTHLRIVYTSFLPWYVHSVHSANLRFA